MAINSDAQVNIFNGVDTKTSYSATNKEKTGVLNNQAFDFVNSSFVIVYQTLNTITDGGYDTATGRSKERVNVGSTTEKIISSNLNFSNDLNIATASDLNIQSSNLKTTEGNIYLVSDNNINITADQASNSNYRVESGKTERVKSKANLEITDSNSTSSTIQSGNNLDITSGNDATLQAAKLTAQDSVNINSGNNLLLLTSTDSSTFSNSNSSKGTYWQSNATDSRFNTDISNTEISSASNNLNLDAKNLIVAEYDKNTYNPTSTTNPNLSYLNTLDPNKAIFNPIEETHIASHTNTRMLTQTGQALVAVGIGAAFAPLAVGAMASVGTAVATTATTQVVTTTINNGGNLGRGVKTLDDKESLQAMAISGLTAGLTAGASQAAGLSGTASTTSTASSTSSASTISSTATTSERLISEAGTALNRGSIGAASYSIANSIVTGQSLGDSLKENYNLEKIAITALGEVGANEIGNSYYNGDISRPTQLTLHAGLGCTLGAASGGDCAASGVSALVAEYSAQEFKYSGLDSNLSATLGKTTGSIAGILTANDDKNAINSAILTANNAVDNNFLLPNEKKELVEQLEGCKGDQGCRDQVQKKFEEVSKPRDEEFVKAYNACDKNGQCDDLKKIHYDLRTNLTEEGNSYYKQHPEEFKKLPAYASIFHTYTQNNKGNVKLFGQNDNTKYIHPILGYEVVLDTNKNIVTNSLNAGTYNFYNPTRSEIKPELQNLLGNNNLHTILDVNPYTLLGNSPSDPTKSYQRGMINRGVGAIKFW